jgi:MATE family multidrug resistance protein
LYIFAASILKLLRLPDEVAELSGVVALWLTPLHLIFGFQFPLQQFLQSQLKNFVIMWLSLAALLASVLISWLFVFVWDFGLVGIVGSSLWTSPQVFWLSECSGIFCVVDVL